jgi:hypothetical protein
VHAQTSQTRVLSLKIGDFEAHTCVTPHQFSMICPWQRDPELNATCREGRVAMFRRRELEGQAQFVAIEGYGLFEVGDEDVDV